MAKSNLNGIRADAYWEMLLAVKILEHELRNSRKFTRDEFGNFAGVVHPTNMMPLINAIGHAHSRLRDIVDREQDRRRGKVFESKGTHDQPEPRFT